MNVDIRITGDVAILSLEVKGDDYVVKCRLDGGRYGNIVAYNPLSPLWAEFEQFNERAFNEVGREKCLLALYWVAEYVGRPIKL